MAKRRKATRVQRESSPVTKYDIEETFGDSEDDYFDGRDKILLEEGPAAKRRRKLEQQEQFLQPSDDEVLSLDSATEEDDVSNVAREAPGNGDSDEEEVWGTSKKDYYDADIIETEADALEEEAEARRLQQKQLKAMTDADFGFDESVWLEKKDQTTHGKAVTEKLPEATLPETASDTERYSILTARYPEFLPLSHDFQTLQQIWVELQRTWKDDRDIDDTIVSTKLQALSTYLGSIAMYFAILSGSAKASYNDATSRITSLSPHELREHAIIGTLATARQQWDMTKDLNIRVASAAPSVANVPAVTEPQIVKKTSSVKVQRSQPPTMIGSGLKEQEMPKVLQFESRNTKEKPQRMNLQSLLSRATLGTDDAESDFGDEAPLTEEQAAEKAIRKRGLRFYTSQIAQKANKRGAAGRQAGGDDDLPHKERLRERQERLLREAERRGQQKTTAGEELGGDDESVIMDAEDEYYQSLVSRSNQKKADKLAKDEAYAEAARQGAQVYEEAEVGPDGKRAITYAIEKNKGLMPRRKKDVRNPRVKKRKKYDEKKKKLASIRQVYKGGEGRGGYGGELTGIKTNTVKSIKL